MTSSAVAPQISESDSTQKTYKKTVQKSTSKVVRNHPKTLDIKGYTAFKIHANKLIP